MSENVPVDTELIRSLRGQEGVREGAMERGFELVLAPPAKDEWREFLDRSLAGLAALLLVAGVFFFFAFNWKALGKFGKFGLLEALLVALFWLGRKERMFLAAASAVIGALLAVYGQTYQTGADSWRLFALWALLALPWVVAANFRPLWLGWVGLLNISFQLYGATPYELFGLNLAAWALAELTRVRSVYFTPVLCVTALFWMLYGASQDIFSREAVPWLLFGFLALVVVVYRARKRGLFFLAAAAGSTIYLVTALVIQALGSQDNPFHWLMVALTIVAQLAVVASWLRFEARR